MAHSQNPKPGDLIEIFCADCQHWAVYVGDGFIVHVASVNGTVLTGVAEVKKEQLCEVVGNRTWIVNNRLDQKYQHRPVCDIVKDACAQVGHIVPYNILTANCEHFVNDLRYGKPESLQVRRGVIAGVFGIFGVIVVVAAVSLTGSKKKKQ